jgi:hypothetical protein
MYILDKDFRLIKTNIQSMRPYRRLKILFYISVTLNIVLSVSLYRVKVKPPHVVVSMQRDTIIKYHDIPLTDSAILGELIKNKCVLPNVALAQFKIESSHYTSRICRENKNIAGIRTSRSQYVAGKKHDHCVYKTYKDCIKDYVLIQNRYLDKIDGKYAEASGYVELIKRMK